MDLSVIVITKNEEENLGHCLKSLPDHCEIIVVDSDSVDRTKEIAQAHGASVYNHSFHSFADQRNTAISYCQRSWVLSIDADEILDEKVVVSLRRIIESSHLQLEHGDSTAQKSAISPLAYRIKRRLVFMGRTMKYGKTTDRPIRLMRRGSGKFTGTVHEAINLPENRIGVLEGWIFHNSYKDLTDYFRRFNRYTSMIASQHFERQDQTNFLMHVMRPWFEFVQRYFFRLGFLDGYPGYVYALNASLYAFIKYSKLIELRQSAAHDLPSKSLVP